MNHSTISKEQILRILSLGKRRLLALGASGVGMSGLCALLAEQGHEVYCYDRDPTPLLQMSEGRFTLLLEREQVRPEAYDLVFYSLAMQQSWESVLEGVPSASRAQMLGALMGEYEHSIGVSGSHGKSTVTALLDHIFAASGLSPTTLVGARLPSGLTYRIGSRGLFVCEACEYRNAFLHLSPSVFLFLNLELDHTDCFENIEKLIASFVKAGEQAHRVILNFDDENLKKVKNNLQNDAITFGFSAECDYRAEWCREGGCLYPFLLYHHGVLIGEVHPSLMGMHGARNTLAAVVAAMEEGVSFADACACLSRFRGIARRLEHIGVFGGHDVYYDYAHHPTEIEASIRAIAQRHHALPTVVFAPHTYTRTRDLWAGFVNSLSLARRALIAPIFAARESPLPDVTSERLAREIGRGAHAVESAEELVKSLGAREPIVLMGAGDLSPFLQAVTQSTDAR